MEAPSRHHPYCFHLQIYRTPSRASTTATRPVAESVSRDAKPWGRSRCRDERRFGALPIAVAMEGSYGRLPPGMADNFPSFEPWDEVLRQTRAARAERRR